MLRIVTNKALWLAMGVVLATPHCALACAACSGRSDDTVVQGLNAAIATLLAVLLVVLGSIVGSVAYLIRRGAKHPLALPGVPKGVV